MDPILDEQFEASGWAFAEPVGGGPGVAGRGSAVFVGKDGREFVIRHYLRGGLVGRLVRDRYLWVAEDRTRPFAEWRLLSILHDRGLRVPKPAAARYRRNGITYTADLITVYVPTIRPLSVCLAEQHGEEFWHRLGASIREFHAAGVFHADMNAYNLQLDDDGRLWMLDLDRGRLIPPGPWQQKTLARLQRSLEKVRAQAPAICFETRNWEQLLAGYDDSSRSA